MSPNPNDALAGSPSKATVQTREWGARGIEWGWGPNRWTVWVYRGMVQMQQFHRDEKGTETPFDKGFWTSPEDLAEVQKFVEANRV